MTEIQIELNKLYEEFNYPSKEQMNFVVKKHGTTIKKVTNWFKQKRRRQFLKGKLNKQNYQKSWFSNEQIAFLKQWFANNMHPNSAQYRELTQLLNTTQKHIKNWFSHQRQKVAKLEKPESSLQQSQQNNEVPSSLTQQNMVTLQQMIQNLSLPQKLQLVLGNDVDLNCIQNFIPYYMNNQYMMMLYLQTQQSYNLIQNSIAKIGCSEQKQSQNSGLQDFHKENFKILTKPDHQF